MSYRATTYLDGINIDIANNENYTEEQQKQALVQAMQEVLQERRQAQTLEQLFNGENSSSFSNQNTQTDPSTETSISTSTTTTQLVGEPSYATSSASLGDLSFQNNPEVASSPSFDTSSIEQFSTNTSVGHTPSTAQVIAAAQKQIDMGIDVGYWSQVITQLQTGTMVESLPKDERLTNLTASLNEASPVLTPTSVADFRKQIVAKVEARYLGQENLSEEQKNYWQYAHRQLLDESVSLDELFAKHQELFLFADLLIPKLGMRGDLMTLPKMKDVYHNHQNIYSAKLTTKAIYPKLDQLKDQRIAKKYAGKVSVVGKKGKSFRPGTTLDFEAKNRHKHLNWVVFDKEGNILEEHVDIGPTFQYTFPNKGKYVVEAYSVNISYKKGLYRKAGKGKYKSMIPVDITNNYPVRVEANRTILVKDQGNTVALHVSQFKFAPTEEEINQVKWLVYKDDKPFNHSDAPLLTEEGTQKQYHGIGKAFTFKTNEEGIYQIVAYANSPDIGGNDTATIIVLQPTVTALNWRFGDGNVKLSTGVSEDNYVHASIPHFADQPVRVCIFFEKQELLSYEARTDDQGNVEQQVCLEDSLIGSLLKEKEQGTLSAKVTSDKHNIKAHHNIAQTSTIQIQKGGSIKETYFMYNGKIISPVQHAIPYGTKIVGVVETVNMVGTKLQVDLYCTSEKDNYSDLNTRAKRYETVVGTDGKAKIEITLDKEWEKRHANNKYFYLGVEKDRGAFWSSESNSRMIRIVKRNDMKTQKPLAVNEFGLTRLTKIGNPYIINNSTREDSYSYVKKDGTLSKKGKHGDDWIKPEKAKAFSNAVYKLIKQYPNQTILLNDCSAYNPKRNLGHSSKGAHSKGEGFDCRFLTVDGKGSNDISTLTQKDIKINAEFIRLLKATGEFSLFFTDKGKIPGSTHADDHKDHIHGMQINNGKDEI